MPRRNWIPISLLVFALAVLAWLSLYSVERWAVALSYPYQIDVSEGFVFQQAVSIARGEPIYHSVNEPPFLVANYPPLYQAVYAAMNGPTVTVNSLPLGRAITVIATLISAMLLGAIVFRMTRRPLPAVVAAMLFLVSFEVNIWSALARVDFPALMLTLSGLLVFVCSSKRWALVAAGMFFVAAFFTRQTAILAPVACAIALARHDRRALPWLVGPAGLAGLAILGWLQLATGGQYWIHTITYNHNIMKWGLWLTLMREEVWFFYHWLIAAMIVAAIACWIRRAASRPGREQAALEAIAIYALFGAVSILMYAKAGAGVNYVIEPLAATVAWLMVSVGRFVNDGRSRAAVAVCALLAIHAGWLAYKHDLMYAAYTPTPIDKIMADKLEEYLRGIDGDLLCEEPVLTMLADRPVLFDSFIMSQLARETKWSQANFIRMLDEKKFARIVVDENLIAETRPFFRYTEPIAAAVRRNYRFVNEVFYEGFPPGVILMPGMHLNYFVYEPRTSPN